MKRTAHRKPTARESLAAYHATRPPRTVQEHITLATMLGLDLDEKEMVVCRDGVCRRIGPTLRARIIVYWQNQRRLP